MQSLSGNYKDVNKFYKNENGDICFRNIDGSYLSVARSMPFDKLLELENKGVPKVDCVVESKYNVKNDIYQCKSVNLTKIKTQKKQFVVKPYFNKANKRVRGKSQILDFYLCTFCGTHHTDDTDECADCISNYERDMKYTRNRIAEISNDHTWSNGAYYDFIYSINEYLDTKDFRGFRRIDVWNYNNYSSITMYFIDVSNKMVSKTIWIETYYEDNEDDYYKNIYEYNEYEIDQYIAEYEYEDPVDPDEDFVEQDAE